MSHVAICARVTVKEGKADKYIAAFAPLLEHSTSEVHAAASPVFAELIAAADVITGETLMAKGLEP